MSISSACAAPDRFRAAATRFIEHKQEDRNRDRRVAQAISIAVIFVLGAVFAALGWILLERPARRDSRRRRRLAHFGDALQVAHAPS